MKKIILNAFGQDQPGLVSKITKKICLREGNIEISKMTQLESDFSLLMLIEISENNIKDLMEDLNEIDSLSVIYKLTDQKKEKTHFTKYLFKISVADNEGIIYLYSNLFKAFEINIINIDTHIKNAANTGFPIFFLEASIMIPLNCNMEEFESELETISQKNNIKYKLKKAD